MTMSLKERYSNKTMIHNFSGYIGYLTPFGVYLFDNDVTEPVEEPKKEKKAEEPKKRKKSRKHPKN